MVAHNALLPLSLHRCQRRYDSFAKRRRLRSHLPLERMMCCNRTNDARFVFAVVCPSMITTEAVCSYLVCKWHFQPKGCASNGDRRERERKETKIKRERNSCCALESFCVWSL